MMSELPEDNLWEENLSDELQEFIVASFDHDLDTLVITNLRLTLQGIDKGEKEAIGEIEKNLGGEDYELFSSPLASTQVFYEDLRRAARNMAVVGLVTRFDHWIGKLTEQIPPEKRNQSRVCHSALINRLHDLNSHLGMAPVATAFFEELVTARDSVIHRNSKVAWEYRERSYRVAQHYTNACIELEFSEEQLSEAIENVQKQVRWYEERFSERKSKSVMDKPKGFERGFRITGRPPKFH